MELYIFDSSLNMKGILEDYFSLRWVRRYSKAGEFELHCSFKSGMLEFLQQDDIIWKSDDLEAGYIVSRELKQDIEGKESLVIKGRFLTSLLGRRIIWGRENISSTAELVVRELIDKNVIAPTIADRKIDLLEMGEVNGFTEDIIYQSSYKNVLEEVERLVEENSYGIRTIVDLERKKLVFDMYKGKDRSADNGVNPPAIFSQEFDNVLEQEYLDSIGGYRSIALVAGEGEREDRKLETIGQGVGLGRYELYVDARDLQSTKDNDITIPESEYRQMLRDRGISKLSESERIEVFNSKVDLNSNLEYKKDFGLGDIVTCTSKRWGVTTDTRITEIEEVYEETGKKINVVLGSNLPTLVEKIKREVR